MQNRAGNVYFSSLPARKLSDVSRKKIFEIEHFRKLVYAVYRLFAVNPVKARARNQVILNRKHAVERGTLKHNAYSARNFLDIRLYVFTADFHISAVFFR